MQINDRTDYAFRLLIFMAARHPQLVTIAQVANAYSISRNHLMKIANDLVRMGYVQSVRGRNGGLRLASPAHEIMIADIFNMGETSTPLVECFDRKKNSCRIAPACTLKFILSDAQAAFQAVLAGKTLADIVPRPQEILKHFN
ncbi:MAG: Rrf2 family transcriptional regulator [Nitratireductor sp.]